MWDYMSYKLRILKVNEIILACSLFIYYILSSSSRGFSFHCLSKLKLNSLLVLYILIFMRPCLKHGPAYRK